MKKQILVFATILMGMSVSAQSWSEEFQIGARGGVNFANVVDSDFDSPDGRTSFYLGLLAELPLSERFSVQPEVFYSGQGYDINDLPNQRDAEFQIDYIQVPLLAKFYLIEGLNLHAGPQFGFKVNEEIDFAPNDNGGDFDTDSIKTFDFQLTGGVEYKFAQSFFVQARYAYGLSEVIDNSEIHNSVFSAGLGYMF